MTPLRLASNIPRFGSVMAEGGEGHQFIDFAALTTWETVQTYRRLGDVDAIVVTTDARTQATLGLARRVFAGPRVVAVDTVLPRPVSVKQRLRARLLGFGFGGVDQFVLHHRNSSGYRTHYGIPADRTRYVPFKVNCWEHQEMLDAITDNGRYLVVGRSNRDIPTFLAAAALTPHIRYAWLRPDISARVAHGTSYQEDAVPANVELMSDDGSLSSFWRILAACRAVIVPIKAGTISAAGLSTYIDAMYLGKAVIMSDAPASSGTIPDDCAEIVAAGDARALAEAVKKCEADAESLAALASRGRAYATSLCGEGRYYRDLLDLAAEVVANPR